MFETFDGTKKEEVEVKTGIKKTEGNPAETGEESYIPEILDDPRLYAPEKPIEENLNPEYQDSLVNGDNSGIERENPEGWDFNKLSHVTALIKEKFADEETRTDENNKIKALRYDTRRMQEIEGFREQGDSNEQALKIKKEIIQANKRDSERIGHIIEYIKQSRTSTEGVSNINAFWANFKTIFYEEAYNRTRRNKTGKQDRWKEGHRYSSPEMIKNGILGEMAAGDLLRGLNVYFTDPENEEPGFENIDFSQVKIRVEESTVEEDVLERTDLKLKISYKGMEFVLPVQVKCAYMQNSDSQKARFLKNTPFILDRHNIETDEPYGDEINKFYKRHGEWGGAFITILHGCDERKVGNDGFPNGEICLPFYEAAKWDIYDFLMKKIKQQS